MTIPLAKTFRGPEAYREGEIKLLPFRFTPLDESRYIATNLVGEHIVLPRADIQRVIRKDLDPSEQLYRDLKSKHFIYDSTSDVAVELLAIVTELKRLGGDIENPDLACTGEITLQDLLRSDLAIDQFQGQFGLLSVHLLG